MSAPATEVDDIPQDLLGRGYMCRTPALARTWEQLRQEIPQDLHAQLADTCFILLKPDLLAAGKHDLFWKQLRAAQVEPLVAWACLSSGLREFEELYKFNLTVNNDQCMLSSWWLHNRPYQMGPVVCLLVRVPGDVRGTLSACDFIAERKGPSNPFRAVAGQWRHDMVSTNMALNLIHTSDDPMSSVREFRVFGTADHLHRALQRSQKLADGAAVEDICETVREEYATAVELSGYPRHDLDLVSTLIRIKLRIAQVSDSGIWISPDLAERFLALLRSGGTARQRWDEYQSLCAAEADGHRTDAAPDILKRLAETSEYTPELADLLDAELRKRRLPHSDWERVVIDTSLFFHDHLPAH